MDEQPVVPEAIMPEPLPVVQPTFSLEAHDPTPPQESPLPPQVVGYYPQINRCQHTGFRLEFLSHYLTNPEGFWLDGMLGARQYGDLKRWLVDAQLLEKKGSKFIVAPLTEVVRKLGVHNPLTWAILWVNLAQRSSLVRWYLIEIPTGKTLTRDQLEGYISDADAPSARTKINAIRGLIDLLQRSPIGARLGLGICLDSSRGVTVTKRGWSQPDPYALLYACYCYAEALGGHHHFSLRAWVGLTREQKLQLLALDPITLFALKVETLPELLQALADRFPNYLKVNFVAGLENIQLNQSITAMEILQAALQETQA